MASDTRKRSGPPLIKEEYNSDDEQRVVNTSSSKELHSEEKLFTGQVYGEVKSEDDVDVAIPIKSSTFDMQPTIPHFTTIYQNFTGHYICPLNECDKEYNNFFKLKRHYRAHCSYHYRPYRCIFPDNSCQYDSQDLAKVKQHILKKHILPSKEVIDVDPSVFVATHTDWLQVEDTLFRDAQIVSPPEVQKPSLYECTFANCSKKFRNITQLQVHFRFHIKLKPFRCSYPNCQHTSTEKKAMLCHIHSVHFNIPARKQRNTLSKEDKERGKLYVIVNQEELDLKVHQLEMVRKRNPVKRNNESVVVGQAVISSSDNHNAFDYESIEPHSLEDATNWRWRRQR